MATPEVMIQAFTQMIATQQAQTMEMMAGPQREVQQDVQGMTAGMKDTGKGIAGQDILKGTPKPIMFEGEPNAYLEWTAKLLMYCT